MLFFLFLLSLLLPPLISCTSHYCNYFPIATKQEKKGSQKSVVHRQKHRTTQYHVFFSSNVAHTNWSTLTLNSAVVRAVRAVHDTDCVSSGRKPWLSGPVWTCTNKSIARPRGLRSPGERITPSSKGLRFEPIVRRDSYYLESLITVASISEICQQDCPVQRDAQTYGRTVA